MIKLTFCLTRLPTLSLEAFHDYWLTTHAPLVASVKDTLRIKRYVQLHSFAREVSEGARLSRDGPEQYDGVAQLWWDSFDDMALTASDPAAREASLMLLEDERRFIDLSSSPLWWGEELAVF